MNKAILIGCGLIGGSIMRELKSHFSEITICGRDRSSENLQQAMELGIIDREVEEADYQNADLVIISIPVDASTRMTLEILDQVGENTLIMDVGSTKEHICTAVSNHSKRHQFLAAHPIAGTEFSGPQAALKDLFRDKTMIVCEVEKTAPRFQDRARELFDLLGVSVRYMTPQSHDRHIAFVSHLSHISSFMLGKTVIQEEQVERDIFDLAGSGFESTVRLAKSSPAMWTPIFALNKKHVLDSLDGYIENLSRFRESVKNDDYKTIFQEMEQTNRIKEILEGISNGK